jgi:hypothetical protein
MFLFAVKVLTGEIPTWAPDNWLTGVAGLVFAIGFFATAYFVGDSSRFGDVFYRINRLLEARRPHFVKWEHNSKIALALLPDFLQGRDEFFVRVKTKGVGYRTGSIPYFPVPNVMTFSDRPIGEVTGSLKDLETLEKECVVEWRPFLIPGTSGATKDMMSLSLDEAHGLIENEWKRL